MPYIGMKCNPGNIKTCECGTSGGEDVFYWVNTGRKNKDGETYYVLSARCKKCMNKRHSQSVLNDRPRFVYRSMKKADKDAGREFSLSMDYIKVNLTGPCRYCGDEILPLTFDRIDNGLGHTETNVVTSCIRCNSMRANMPHKAWMALISTVRIVRENGLFEDWSGVHGSSLKYSRC